MYWLVTHSVRWINKSTLKLISLFYHLFHSFMITTTYLCLFEYLSLPLSLSLFLCLLAYLSLGDLISFRWLRYSDKHADIICVTYRVQNLTETSYYAAYIEPLRTTALSRWMFCITHSIIRLNQSVWSAQAIAQHFFLLFL